MRKIEQQNSLSLQQNSDQAKKTFIKKKDSQHRFQKNTLHQREFFQCFCARNYQSYSALYLHVKIKHNQNLSFKSLKQKTTEWSGSIKNVIYQFGEEQQMQDKNVQKLGRMLRERTIKKSFKQYSSQQEKPKQSIVKKQHLYVDDNIIQVLAKYQILSQMKTSKFKKNVLSKLIKFVDLNYKTLFAKSEEFQSFCQLNTCENIPLILNQFIESQYSLSPQKERVMAELLKLSNWLYDNSYSSRLIVEQTQYQKFNSKVEQNNKGDLLKQEIEYN